MMHGITWQKHTIDSYLERASSVLVVDIDDDGNMDVVACGIYADSVVWYKNDGGIPITWTRLTIDSALDGAYNLDVADIDADLSFFEARTAAFFQNGGQQPIVTILRGHCRCQVYRNRNQGVDHIHVNLITTLLLKSQLSPC